jgi:hypothetical protein
MSTACSRDCRDRTPTTLTGQPQPRVFSAPSKASVTVSLGGLPPVAGGLIGTGFRFLLLINGF